ncbi:MAG: hypothetical protein CEE42_12510 [Promethearchaeota archaeon Loki_b31]|nr:MAG: hypothetical protein CEE42_12510 [Candidatus Lokiarchaeota archaeon Loki_b31]
MAEIEWSSKAENDLNEIIDYIAQDSLEYALSFYEQVREKREDRLSKIKKYILFVLLFLYKRVIL